MRTAIANHSFAGFQKRLKPLLAGMFREIYADNPGSIRVKKEEVAIRNIERIFHAALVLSMKKGFDAMSLRELSRESGLSMGALYTYFSSKEELRGHILTYGVRFAAETVRADAREGEGAAGRLEGAIRSHLYLSEALRPWFYFAYMEARNLSKEEKKKAMHNERMTESVFLEIIEAGAASGEFAGCRPELTAAAVKAMLQDWYLKRWKYREAGVDVEQYARFMIDFIIRAIGPDGRDGGTGD